MGSMGREAEKGMPTRRRFITIASALALSGLAGGARAGEVARWRGVALGAAASITLSHPDAARLLSRARGEIARLEAIFSLYRPVSALCRLNAVGRLTAPPAELLELLTLVEAIHARSAGAFDPTIQPLWRLHAACHGAGRAPSAAEREAARGRTGWRHVTVSASEIAFARPGMALTLNGIAQGYIADRIAALFRTHGVGDVLIDMGEIVALGRGPSGSPWRIGLADPDATVRRAGERMELHDRAVATSAPRGTVFDAAGQAGHILDPRTGAPGGNWRQVSVVARTAALADGLSTAGCLLEEAQIRDRFHDVEVRLWA